MKTTLVYLDLLREIQVRLFGREFFSSGVCSSSIWLLTVCSLGWWGIALPCSAEDGWEGDSVFLNVDNDATAGTDRHYTHGAHAGWFSGDGNLPVPFRKLSHAIPAWGFDVKAEKWGVGAGQELYTPGNLDVSEVILNDRPYAAWLFADVALQRRGEGNFGWLTMETFRLDVGVIGPPALGEETQDLVHSDKPRGWNNQLHTEPGLILSYDRRYRWAVLRSENEVWGLDFIPHGGVSLGNIETFFALGPMVRVGINLPNEFAAEAKPCRFGAYLFTSLDGRFVLRNIFLDGNTFRSSHNVEKELLVGDFKVGLTLIIKNVELTAAQTWRTWEFESQEDIDSFGSATVTIKF